MAEAIFFIAGNLIGFVMSWVAFKQGSKSAHQAYEIIYTAPADSNEEPNKENIKRTQNDLYDWDSYDSNVRFQQFEEDDDNLDEPPN